MSAAKVIDGSRLVTGAYPVKYAREWVESVHRRIPEMVGAMWCIGLWRGREMRGLAVVGRPSARMLGAPARTRVPLLEVLRVAVVEEQELPAVGHATWTVIEALARPEDGPEPRLLEAESAELRVLAHGCARTVSRNCSA